MQRLAPLADSQWGLLTTAQAETVNVSRLTMSRLAADGIIERVRHAVYRVVGSPATSNTNLKAAWLALSPKTTAIERLSSKTPDSVVIGPTAANLLGIGALLPEPYQFAVPTRKQSQQPDLVFRTRILDQSSITRRDGLPVTTPEQTIADLLAERVDLSNVADAFREAGGIDTDVLSGLVTGEAKRLGFESGDGAAVVGKLVRLAGLDENAIVKTVLATPVAKSIAEAYLRALDPYLLKATMAPIVEANARLMESFAKNITLPVLPKISEHLLQPVLPKGLLDQMVQVQRMLPKIDPKAFDAVTAAVKIMPTVPKGIASVALATQRPMESLIETTEPIDEEASTDD